MVDYPMRTAVLFTGQQRTLSRVLPLLKRNLLDRNNVTLFFACEGSDELLTMFDGYEIGGSLVLPSFRTEEFGCILGMLSGRPSLTEEVFDRARKADGLAWTIDYVKNSGTVLQYYQLWKAYCLMLAYEKKHGLRFDVCVRGRLDMLLTEPLNLSSVLKLYDTEEDARSLGSQRMASCTRIIKSDSYEHPRGTYPTSRIVWTLGHEQCWICKRDLFDVFGPMVFSYGTFPSNNTFAFNSETFFHETCKNHSVVHYVFMEDDNPIFNCTHPGTDPVLDDPWVFSLLR